MRTIFNFLSFPSDSLFDIDNRTQLEIQIMPTNSQELGWERKDDWEQNHKKGYSNLGFE
jgi:hypothetical protein